MINSAKNNNDPDISIVLPTFNEKENIVPLLEQIISVFENNPQTMECIFVDDSTDDTAEIIKSQISKYGFVKLIKRYGEEARTGLTMAFKRGFLEARGRFIVCMDTDLQHPPRYIPRLLKPLHSGLCDLSVASRYVKGGSADGLDGFYRRLVSRIASFLVWFLIPKTRKTSDPMTGFFAFKKDLLSKIKLESNGFKILAEIIVQSENIKIKDIPFVFESRQNEQSKAVLGQGIKFLKDIKRIFFNTRFGNNSFKYFLALLPFFISAPFLIVYLEKQVISFGYSNLFWFDWVSFLILLLPSSFLLSRLFLIKKQYAVKIQIIWLGVSSWLFFSFQQFARINEKLNLLLAIVMIFISAIVSFIIFLPAFKNRFDLVFKKTRWIVFVFFLLFVANLLNFVKPVQIGYWILLLGYSVIVAQGIFALYLMIYSWDQGNEKEDRFSGKDKQYLSPKFSFTAIVPCKHEKNTIRDTLFTLNNMSYPENLKQVLVVIHKDTDDGTIDIVEKAIKDLGVSNISLVTYNQKPVNKPNGLNYALEKATGDLVVIFDAEDEPHLELYHLINTEMIKRDLDVLQSGVQLMNYNDNWYSVFNVLEYYFWFKSSLHFFAKKGVMTLGGVSVFFKREWLKKVGGWDITCLTEDADIGIKLSEAGAKIGVVYDSKYATQEETPHSVWSFVKQRTRWAQGFLQIVSRGVWRRMPTFSQKVLALYVLSWPITLLILFMIFPLGILLMLFVTVNPTIAILSNIPLILFLVFVVVQLLGLYEFTQEYKKPFPWLKIPLIIVTFYPYTVLLAFSGLRAMYRNFNNNNSWEKTEHLNKHRAGQENITDMNNVLV